MQLIRNSFFGLALVGVGWVLGSVFPAPGQFTALARERARPVLERLDFSQPAVAELRRSLSPEQLQQLSRDAALFAASTGEAIRVERAPAEVVQEYADVVQSAQQTPGAGASFEVDLHLCGGMHVSNAPPADENNKVQRYANVVNVNGVSLAANPTHGACLSSGVRPRNGGTHKGVDFYSRNGGPILAAGSGTVIEQVYRDDYGNMLLIDHGSGVYTRYAHLSSFAPGVEIGARVNAGQQIGLMGNTASYPIPIHLHYEILLGAYANRAGSFGLTPRSPFEFAAAEGSSVAAQAVTVVPLQLTREARTREQCPGGPITSAATITIRHGDTLASIASACYGDEEAWRAIVSCNRYLERRNLGGVSPLSTGHLLYIGDRMMLPAPGTICAI